jgi:flagellar hook-basal body complex protein FliE
MTDAVAFLPSRLGVSGPPGVERPSGPVSISPAGGAPSFGQVLEQVSFEAVQSLRGAEATSIAALQGQVSTLEVVEAIKSAEQALQTATAVRDKIVQAYQDVSRMTI